MAVVPNEGVAWIVLKCQDSAPISNAKMLYGCWGTGAQTEATVKTASPAFGSFTESAEARALGTQSVPASQTDRLVWTQTATANRNITQCATTNTSTVSGSGQTMGFYAAFTSIPLQTGDQITFTADKLLVGV